LSGRGLCDELITRLEESYRLCCVVVCDLETSRMGAPYIHDISHLRVNHYATPGPNDKEYSHKIVIEKKQSQFSIIFVLASQYSSCSVWCIALDGFCPWVRGGCMACSRGQGGFRCDEDVYPSSYAQRIVEILQPPFFLASLVFWLFLASMVFGITLSPVHVCTHFGTLVLKVV